MIASTEQGFFLYDAYSAMEWWKKHGCKTYIAQGSADRFFTRLVVVMFVRRFLLRFFWQTGVGLRFFLW